MTEALLYGGELTAVVRVGDTVWRATGPWSPAVHALLLHFERVGFDGAPRFLGLDEQNLRWLEAARSELGWPDGDDRWRTTCDT